MQKAIDFDEYRRSLAQLDLFDDKLNRIKERHHGDVAALAAARKEVQERGVIRMLKSSHYGFKKS